MKIKCLFIEVVNLQDKQDTVKHVPKHACSSAVSGADPDSNPSYSRPQAAGGKYWVENHSK